MDTISSFSRSEGSAASVRQRSASADPAALFRPIEAELGKVEQLLVAQLQSRHASLAPVLRHGVLLGGKRLRPALLLLSGAAAGTLSETHIKLATVLEMVHTATLVHDDLIDGATSRRHAPTVHQKWGAESSILLGDFLFAQSFTLAASTGSAEACEAIGGAARRVCEGELRQVASQGELQLDEPQYLEMIEAKTAELCGVACRLGGRHAGAADDQVAALEAFGRHLGIAFQIADDYLDLWGDGERVGKTLGTDVLQGKMTMPLIHTMEVLAGPQKEALRRLLQGPPAQRLAAIYPLLERADAAAYTRRRAGEFVAAAEASLDRLPASEAKATLRRWARFALERRF